MPGDTEKGRKENASTAECVGAFGHKISFEPRKSASLSSLLILSNFFCRTLLFAPQPVTGRIHPWFRKGRWRRQPRSAEQVVEEVKGIGEV